MKIFKSLILFAFILSLASCSNNDDVIVIPTNVTFNFTHSWQDLDVNVDEFNILQYVTENEDSLLISRLRYLISDFVFTHESGTSVELSDFLLIDLEDESSLTTSTQDTILPGTYTISFRFGLLDEKNLGVSYPNLISSNFNISDDVNDGYHYMQFEGEFIDSLGVRQPFDYSAVSAVDPSGINEAEDTSFEVILGAVVIGETTTININMDVYEWFSNPNTWDLNELSVMLEENFDAQIDIGQNGASVFTLGDVIP